MSQLAAATVPLNALKPPPAAAALTPAQIASQAATRATIGRTAKAFEAQFISAMLGSMFDGVEPDAPFSGGEGEQAFKSFLMDAIGKQMTQAGGLGVSAVVQREMLKMQGLK
ncbi:MAG: rod-binding protein [Caulobacteraceae bacterium]|nr:rod-binding protein [Caulobacteraceae bacterium]